MEMDLSQSWLAQMGRSGARDGLIVLGLMAITAGALSVALTMLTPAPALLFIGRVLTAIGGLFLALPLFLGATGDDRWSGGVRIAGLVVGFLIILVTLIRI